jgi:hypothetical protein
VLYPQKENAKSENKVQIFLFICSQDFLLLVILLVVDGDGSAKDG